MTLTITDKKYLKPYDGSSKASRWQTDIVAKDIGVVLDRNAIKFQVHSDDTESLISWSTPRMQLWIGIECTDTDAPSFQLSIGAGKRVMFIFSRSFPDSSYAEEPWLLQLKQLASEERHL
ncbi:MAG: hypothetical protein JWM68_2402 [Verrucomicrobiales bacterium]|nr:hypothetical protein [Verrucomicrobiales bacterium]